MALIEARNRQIGCLCLSVGVDHDDTRLQDTFGAQDYLRFTSWDTLRGDLAPLLRTAIRASRRLTVCARSIRRTMVSGWNA